MNDRPIFSISLLAAAVLLLQSCKDVRAVAETTAPKAELVILGDGTTMVARKGSLSRAIADWLTNGETQSKAFAFGADAFVAGSARLSPKGLGHAADLGTLLRAAPDTELILNSATGPDERLAVARARTLARFLEERGILPDQVGWAASTAVAQTARETRGLPFLLRRRDAAAHASMARQP